MFKYTQRKEEVEQQINRNHFTNSYRRGKKNDNEINWKPRKNMKKKQHRD